MHSPLHKRKCLHFETLWTSTRKFDKKEEFILILDRSILILATDSDPHCTNIVERAQERSGSVEEGAGRRPSLGLPPFHTKCEPDNNGKRAQSLNLKIALRSQVIKPEAAGGGGRPQPNLDFLLLIVLRAHKLEPAFRPSAFVFFPKCQSSDEYLP